MGNYIVWFIVFYYSFIAINQKENRGSIAMILFLVLGTLQSLISPDYCFFGFISPDNISVLVVIIVSYLGINSAEPFRDWNILKRNAFIFFLVVSIIFPFLINIKDVYIFNAITLDVLLKRTFRDILIVYGFFTILQWTNKPFFISSLKISILIIVGLGSLSAAFPSLFQTIGLAPSIRFFSLDATASQDYMRNSGFIGGNVNFASMVINILAGWAFATLHNPKIKIYAVAILFFCFFGIINMASKNAIATFSLNFLVFLFFQYRFVLKNMVLVGVFSLSLLFVFISYGNIIMKRIEMQETGEEDTFSSRLGYWQAYSKNFYENPDYYLLGKSDKVQVITQNPHNFFIYLTYYGGLIFLIPFLIIFGKFIRVEILYGNRLTYSNRYILIAFTLGIMTSHGIPHFIFPLLVASSSSKSLNLSE